VNFDYNAQIEPCNATCNRLRQPAFRFAAGFVFGAFFDDFWDGALRPAPPFRLARSASMRFTTLSVELVSTRAIG
jgi:hypothetical protein